MSKSQPSTSNRKFWIIAGTTVALSSALVVSIVPQLHRIRDLEAARLVGEAKLATGAEAEADYRLAHRLNPANQEAALHFAVIQTNLGNSADALVILASAGEGREVEVARIRAALEAGKSDIAVASADRLLTMNPVDSEVVLAAAAYGVADKPTQALALVPRVTSPEALQGVRRAGADKLALASVLADRGLEKSSSSLLVKLPNSVIRSLLMARILIDQNTPASLTVAVDYLNSGVSIDPSNSVLRTTLVATLRTLKRTDEADKQQLLLDKLTIGRP